MDEAPLRSLHGVLAALLLPLLLGLGVAGGALVWGQYRIQRDAVDTRLQDSADYLALLLERELAIETAIIEAMAQSPLIDRGEWQAFHALAGRVASRRRSALIALTDASGQLIVNTSVAYGSPLVNVYDIERENRQIDWKGTLLPVSTGGLTRKARETGRPAFSNLYYGVATREPSLAVAIPVERAGAAPYTLTYAFSARSIADFIAARNTFPDALAQVVDRDGRVVASSRAHDEFVAQPVPASLIGTANASVGEARYPDDQPWVIAKAGAGPSGWKVVLGVPARRGYAQAFDTLWTSLTILAGVMALAALLVYRHSRRLSRPLLQLAARVGGAGNTPAPATDIREIAVLADAIRTADLAREREREEQVRRRLAEEHEAHARELAAELQAADLRKNEFLATLAHELRNPLGPLLNAVHLLDQREGGNAPDTAKLKAIMMRQLKHIGCLVEDLLDVTRIAQGKIELRVRASDLGELLQRIADDYEPVLAQSRVALTLDMPRERISAEVDPTRFTQMVANLLQNAARFTPEGGRVTLLLSGTRDVARIAVADSGVGIERDMLERLFEPFVQGAQHGARSGGGLGLGLAIVKGLAELHGGRVSASSRGAGQGAEFVIEVPRKAA